MSSFPFSKIGFVFLFLVATFKSISQINIQTNIPPIIAPNSTLNIEVKINKGAISNFAKYQMDFPAGVSATEGNSFSGSFTFEEGRMKLVWVSLPAENEFVVTFHLINGNSSGSAVLNNKFYFVENGTKKDFEPDPVNIKFDPTGVTAATPLNTANFTATASAVSVENTRTVEPVVNTKVPDSPKETPKEVPVTNKNTGGVEYKLQLSASAADPGKAKFSSVGHVNIVHEAGMYKVLFGSYNTKEEALKKREELLQKGQSSFVVAYLNGVRQK